MARKFKNGYTPLANFFLWSRCQDRSAFPKSRSGDVGAVRTAELPRICTASRLLELSSDRTQWLSQCYAMRRLFIMRLSLLAPPLIGPLMRCYSLARAPQPLIDPDQRIARHGARIVGGARGPGYQHADPHTLALLRMRSKRPRRRVAQPYDETRAGCFVTAVKTAGQRLSVRRRLITRRRDEVLDQVSASR